MVLAVEVVSLLGSMVGSSVTGELLPVYRQPALP